MNKEAIEVLIPDNFTSEREYVISIIFEHFLGCSVSLKVSNEINDWYIGILDKTLIVKDSFFNHIKKENWIQSKNIPHEVNFVSNDFTFEKDIPVLFGKNEIEFQEHEVTIGHDIFADVFFMLSRWEEKAIDERDYLGRFPVHASLSFKFNFLHRPVVNEWIEMLKNIIRRLVPSFRFNIKHKFELIFTHDVDLLNTPVTIREFAKDILKRKSIKAFSKRINYLLSRKNPYDVFDYYMDVSEKHDTLSRFYFMTGHNLIGKDGEPYNNTPLYLEVIKKIKDRGHIIGFHPSLFTYNNPDMFLKEKNILERDTGLKIKEGRQHALRFAVPDTWRIWEDAGMETDSTMGFSGKEGFRCGTGNTFPVFDIIRKKQLKLKESPLIVMDTTLHINRKLSENESKAIIRNMIETGNRYNMPINLLFHNLIADTIDWNDWKSLHEELFWNN